MTVDGDLNDLVIFTKVVESRSFTGAGRALAMPRSTVSRRVAELEKRLGVRLMQRTTRSLQLTDLGARYYEQAARALATIAEAETQLKEAQVVPRGHLRMSAPHDISSVLAPMVASFLCKHRQVTVTVDLGQRFVDLVEEGYDLAIRATTALPDSSLVARRVLTATARLHASQLYLQRAGVPASPHDLASHQLIALGSRRTHATWPLTKGSERIELPVEPSMWVNDPGFARRAAQNHVGIAMLPSPTAWSDETLVHVLPQWTVGLESSIYVVYPSAKHLSATVRAFRDHLIESFAALTSAECGAPVADAGGPRLAATQEPV